MTRANAMSNEPSTGESPTGRLDAKSRTQGEGSPSVSRNGDSWNEAIEAAAKRCEAVFADHYEHSQRRVGSLICAEAVRALKR